MGSPFARRRRLAAELRQLREEAGLTSDKLAKLVGQHRIKISRLENGHLRPDVREIMALLDALQVKGTRWHEVVQIAREAGEKGWWDSYGDAMGERQKLYADLEFGSSRIREYQPAVVPGLLQTAEYTWALVGQDTTQTYKADRVVEAREQRQRMLDRPDGPDFEVILDEVVVRRLVVSPAVMRDQLLHIVDTVRASPRLSVRVLPVSAVVSGFLPSGTFMLFKFVDPRDPQMAVVETVTTDLVLDSADDVGRYVQHYERVRDATLSADDSLSLLEQAATQHTEHPR